MSIQVLPPYMALSVKSLNSVNSSKTMTGADPGFPVEGGATPPWEGSNIHILPKTA